MASKKNLRIYQDEFIRLYKEGVSIRKIAEQYNVSKTCVAPLIKEKMELRPKSSISKEILSECYKDFLCGLSVYEIANKYNKHYSSVKRALIKHYGVKFDIKRQYEHLVSDFKRDYKEGMSLNEISKRYGVSRQTILEYLNQEDITARNYVESCYHKIDINGNYFDELNNEKAYLLGKIFALGNITKSVSKREFLSLNICLDKKDELVDIVSKFSDKNIDNIEYSNRNGKVITASVRLFDEYLISKVREYGLETGNININKNYLYDFYKGFFEHKITFTKKYLYISGDKVSKEVILNYVSNFINPKLISLQPKSLLIHNKEGSVLLLKEYPSLIEKLEDYLCLNDTMHESCKKRWTSILETVKLIIK